MDEAEISRIVAKYAGGSAAPIPLRPVADREAGSFPVPDALVDEWLSVLSCAELKVMLYLLRRTAGFGKAADRVSLTQLCTGIARKDGTHLDRGTGLARTSVVRALGSLQDRGLVVAMPPGEDANGHVPNGFRLNWERR